MNPAGLAILAEEGFRYDSSIVPCLPIPGWYGNLTAPLSPYQLSSPSPLWEFPVCVHPLLRLPGGGGYYFRNLGYFWTRWVLLSCLKKLGYAMFYLHPWELSNHNPKLPGVPFFTFRRTGDWTRRKLGNLLDAIQCTPDLQCHPIAEAI